MSYKEYLCILVMYSGRIESQAELKTEVVFEKVPSAVRKVLQLNFCGEVIDAGRLKGRHIHSGGYSNRHTRHSAPLEVLLLHLYKITDTGN
jgi:hypothetical protein